MLGRLDRFYLVFTSSHWVTGIALTVFIMYELGQGQTPQAQT